MKPWRNLHVSAAAVAALGLVIQPALLHGGDTRAGRPQEAATLSDVALGEGGVLRGQVVDTNGVGLSKVAVALRSGSAEVATAVTDAQGQFSVPNLPGGVFQVVSGPNAEAYRLWTPGTAPQAAASRATIVSGAVVRGQSKFGFWGKALLITGVVALAVAIPVAIVSHNNNNGS